MEDQPTVIPDYYIPFLERVMGSLVETVPEEISECQFNCSASECSHEEWTLCRRRLDAQALKNRGKEKKRSPA